jgi:hypothetical protein
MYRLFFLVLVVAFRANAQPPNGYYSQKKMEGGSDISFDSLHKTFSYSRSRVSKGFVSHSAMQGSFEIKGDSIVLTCKPKALTTCKKIDFICVPADGYNPEVKTTVKLSFACNVSTSSKECGLGKLPEVKTLPIKWYKVVVFDRNKKMLFTRTIKANQAPFSTEVPLKKMPLYAKITDDKGAVIIDGDYLDKYEDVTFNGWQYYPCECGGDIPHSSDTRYTTNCRLVYHYKKSEQNIVLNGGVFQFSQTPLKKKKN